MTQHTGYVPGVCNIGPAERKARRLIGWIGLMLTVVMTTVLIMFKAKVGWYASIFLASSLSASGFIQDSMHFCANFGLRHLFNIDAGVGNVQLVKQRELWAADRRKAFQIVALSVCSGLAVTGVALFVRSLF